VRRAGRAVAAQSGPAAVGLSVLLSSCRALPLRGRALRLGCSPRSRGVVLYGFPLVTRAREPFAVAPSIHVHATGCADGRKHSTTRK